LPITETDKHSSDMDNELFGEMHEQEENGLYGKRHERELLCLSIVSGSVFPCFTECGEIFAIAESHSQAVRIAKDRYGEDIPDEMLAAIIDEWELGKHYR